MSMSKSFIVNQSVNLFNKITAVGFGCCCLCRSTGCQHYNCNQDCKKFSFHKTSGFSCMQNQLTANKTTRFTAKGATVPTAKDAKGATVPTAKSAKGASVLSPRARRALLCLPRRA